ncbi:MAG: EamA family transporter [Nanoarchaeota archaeon]|nr:EamA family transporter [Nanoarchaeota archaeon]
MSDKAPISFWNNGMFAVILVLISTVLVSFAQVTFKMAWSDSENLFSFINVMLLSGFALYAVGAFLFMIVLRKKKVSYLFPFMTLSYVWVIFLSAFLFGETITLFKLLGVALIFTGVFLIYAGGKSNGKGAAK